MPICGFSKFWIAAILGFISYNPKGSNLTAILSVIFLSCILVNHSQHLKLNLVAFPIYVKNFIIVSKSAQCLCLATVLGSG